MLAAFDCPAMPRFSRGVLAAWAVRLGFVFLAIALPGLFVDDRQAAHRARPAVRARATTSGPMPVQLACPLCELPVRPRHHGLRGAGRHRRDLSAGEGADVDLRRPDRAQPGRDHRASSERRDRRRHRRRGGRAPGAQLVRRPPAGFYRRTPTVPCVPMPGPSLRRIIKAVARRLHSA